THSGAAQAPRSPVNGCKNMVGEAYDLTKALAGTVDAVISAHTHQAYVCKIKGTQLSSAASYSRMLTTLKLSIDTTTHKVVSISARNTAVDHKRKQNKKVAATVTRYRKLLAPISDRKVGYLKKEANRNPDRSGETVLGNIAADAQLRATRKGRAKARIALVAHGLLRTNINKGTVTYGEV